jgi:NAD(P)H-nitrite reductase large subunit
MDRLRALGVDLRLDTLVWGIFPDRTLALAHADRTQRLRADAIVFATGAHDRPVPFPGWTLPGAVTAGGAQNLMKGYGVLPGRRVLVAGSGPLLLVVAHHLRAGGADVVAVAEAASMCRCEEVRAAAIDVAIDEGARLVNEVKTVTRAGMGRCLGRLCGATVAAMIARAGPDSPAAAGTYTTCVSVKPLSFAALAGGDDPEEGPT